MNLERCIEKDMVRFLDAAVAPTTESNVARKEDAAFIYANKDFEAEIQAMLKRNDLAGAKELFTALKERYNQTPEDHVTERTSLYDTVQKCYLAIVNFMQERERTQELLVRMEQAPSDVFNTSVRPVNLQVAERVSTPQADYAPLTKQSFGAAGPPPQVIVLQVPQTSAGAVSSVQYLPPRPVGQPLRAPSRQVSSLPVRALTPAQPVVQEQTAYQAQQPAVQSAPPVMPPIIITQSAISGNQNDAARRERQINQSVHATMKRCLELGKSDPTQALGELRELGDTILAEQRQGRVGALLAKQLLGEIEQLQRSIQNYQDRQSFDRSFNQSYASLSSLARTKQGSAVAAFITLWNRTQDYEKANPSSPKQYSEKLAALKDEYALYTEEEVIARVNPLITRIKLATQMRARSAFEQAYADLDRFTRMLPHTPERAMLEHTVTGLRARREMIAAQAAEPEETTNG